MATEKEMAENNENFKHFEKTVKDTANKMEMGFKTKAQMMWDVSREQEELFKKGVPKIVDGIDVNEFFKLIRDAEYRRGKEDRRKELSIPTCKQQDNSNYCNDNTNSQS